MNAVVEESEKMYYMNMPSQLIARSGQGQYLGHLLTASDVQ